MVEKIRVEAVKRLKKEYPDGKWSGMAFRHMYLEVEEEFAREGKLARSYKDAKEDTTKKGK